jgi:hypothetical protein
MESLTYRTQQAVLLCVTKSSQHLLRKHTAPQAVVFVAGVQRSGTNLMMQTQECSMQMEVFQGSDSRAFHDFKLNSPSVIETFGEKVAYAGDRLQGSV